MDLFKLKQEIDNLNKQKSLFEGSLMQINEEIRNEGFSNLEEMEETLSLMEKKLEEMQARFDKEMTLAEDFIREIHS